MLERASERNDAAGPERGYERAVAKVLAPELAAPPERGFDRAFDIFLESVSAE